MRPTAKSIPDKLWIVMRPNLRKVLNALSFLDKYMGMYLRKETKVNRAYDLP
jgi:hypothetical protein